MSPSISSIWNAILSQISNVQKTLNKAISASGPVGYTTLVVMTIFWVYAAYKIYECWIVAEDGSFTRKLHWIWTNYRRALIVYLLIIASPALISVPQTLAVGYAKTAQATITTGFQPIVATLDQLLSDATGLFGTVPSTLAIRAGQSTTLQILPSGWTGQLWSFTPGDTDSALVNRRFTYTQRLADSAIAQQQALLKDAQTRFPNNTALISTLQARVNDLQTTLKGWNAPNGQIMGNAANMAGATGTGNTSTGDWRYQERQAIYFGLQKLWENEFDNTGVQIVKSQNAETAVSSNASALKTIGAKNWMVFQIHGGWSDQQASDTLINQLTTETNRICKELEDERNSVESWIPKWGSQLAGFLGALICAGVVLMTAVNVIKSAYGAILHLVSFIATVIFAAAISIPLAPAFFLCFISDKTESYGRSFVNFWFSAVFASMGMCLMAHPMVAVWKLLAQSLLIDGQVALIQVLHNTDTLSQFAMSILIFAAYLVVFGMAFTFVGDFLKKGAAVGSGLFSGHFPG